MSPKAKKSKKPATKKAARKEKRERKPAARPHRAVEKVEKAARPAKPVAKAPQRPAAAKQVEVKEEHVEVKAQRRPKAVLGRPKGAVPEAEVSSRHEGGLVQRAGKGFSFEELSGAGVPLRLARRWGVRVDGRRRSALGPNVRALKSWFVPVRKETAGEPLGEGAKAQKAAKPRARGKSP